MAVLTLLGLALVLLFVLSRFLARPRSNLPSPKGIPILGNLLQFRQDRSELLMTKWSREVGPAYCLRLFNIDVVIVNDCDTIHQVMLKKGKAFAGRPIKVARRARFINDHIDTIFLSNPGPEWKFLRHTLHSNVKMYEKGLRQVESVNMEAIDDMVSELTRLGGETPFNPKTVVYNTVMNIICVFILGRTFGQDDPFFLLAKEVEQSTAAQLGPGSKGTELDIMWWLRHFGNKSYKKLVKLVEQKRELWRQARAMVEEDLAGSDGKMGGIIHSMLDKVTNKRHNVPDAIDEDSVQGVFHDLIMAGTTTTSNSFYSFLNIMTHYPQVQAMLRQEVDEVVGEDRAVSFEDRAAMPYTRATVLELTRYTSVVPMGVGHSTLEDTEINGYTVPKDTVVITNLWALHHDEDFWTDPWNFRPERFLDESGELLPADHEVRKHLLPFGAGTRVCLGESLALGRLFLLIATVIQKFKLLPGLEPQSCDPRLYATGIVIGNADFEMCFIPRH